MKTFKKGTLLEVKLARGISSEDLYYQEYVVDVDEVTEDQIYAYYDRYDPTVLSIKEVEDSSENLEDYDDVSEIICKEIKTIKIDEEDVKKINLMLSIDCDEEFEEYRKKEGLEPDKVFKNYSATFDNGYKAEISVSIGYEKAYLDAKMVISENIISYMHQSRTSILGKYFHEAGDDLYIVEVEIDNS